MVVSFSSSDAPSPSSHSPFHHPSVASFSASYAAEDHHAYNAHNNAANMGHEKEKPHLDIILDTPYLALKGTGPDVEPATLSGHVALHLPESTSIKEITLQFRGKARIPIPASDSLINNNTSISSVVCNHDWSFLEGDKRHSRTLKAGRHFFPFHLEIGGCLPSSISTITLGGASIAYKLRAVASRPGLSQNLQAIAPVHILRSFTHEALEYQQSLEIENTWPEKIMYAIMLPHKAWAAGDTLAAVFKISPLTKGISVQGVVSTLHETTKVYARTGSQEVTRVLCTAKHEIINGKAVEVDAVTGNLDHSSLAQAFSPPAARAHASSSQGGTHDDPSSHQEGNGDYGNSDVVTYIKMTIPPSAHVLNNTGSGSTVPNSPTATSSGFASLSSSSPSHTPNSTSEPSTPFFHATVVTPSHALEPITVSHRIRWTICIGNRDGHISELRCSLPVIILDGRLLQESREMSIPTRRLMLGSAGLGRHGDNWVVEDGSGSSGAIGGAYVGDEDIFSPMEGDRELPSYTAHLRDRVANMFLPEAVTMRVSNPWVGRVGNDAESPSAAGEVGGVGGGTALLNGVTGSAEGNLPSNSSSTNARPPRSGTNTTGTNTNRNSASNFHYYVDQHTDAMGRAHLPHEPGVGEATPLDWVNSELLLSLSDEPLRRMTRSTGASGGMHSPGGAPSAPHNVAAGHSSAVRSGSRWGSRAHSRAGSVERGVRLDEDGVSIGRGTTSRPATRPPSPSGPWSPVGHAPALAGYGYEALSSSPPSGSGSQAHHVHRNLSNFFKATMKPFTALAGKHLSDKEKERESPSSSAPHSVAHSPCVLSREGSHSNLGQLDHSHSMAALQRNPYHTSVHPNGMPSNPMNVVSFADPAWTTSDMSNPTRLTLSSSSSQSSFQQAHDQYPHVASHGSAPHSPSPLAHSMPSPGPMADRQYHQPNPLETSQSRGKLNAAASTSALLGPPASGTSSTTTIPIPSLLHRALTEVPDYSIASRGFIGGVPPLTSMRGLPSYEEAARDSRRSTDIEHAPPGTGSSHQPAHPGYLSLLREQVGVGGSTEPTTTATSSSERNRSDLVGNSDSVGRFDRNDDNVPQAGLNARDTTAVSEEGDDDSDDDEGIQMQTRARRAD